jgi:hypothetical protein
MPLTDEEAIEWLQERTDESARVLAKATKLAQEHAARVSERIKEYSTWKDALNSALSRAGLPLYEDPPFSSFKDTAQRTIANLAAVALRERGPMTSKELRVALAESDKVTTTNTVTVTLNRDRPKRFDRDKEGRWFLTQQESEKE